MSSMNAPNLIAPNGEHLSDSPFFNNIFIENFIEHILRIY